MSSDNNIKESKSDVPINPDFPTGAPNPPATPPAPVDPRKWLDKATKFESSLDTFENYQALFEGGLYYDTLAGEEKVKFYPTLAKIYKNYFSINCDTKDEEESKTLIENFEESIERWALLGEELNDCIDLEENADEKKKRLDAAYERAKQMYLDIPADLVKLFVNHMKTDEFKTFLKTELGNKEIVDYLDNKPELKNTKEALDQDPEAARVIEETTNILDRVFKIGNEEFPEFVVDMTNTKSNSTSKGSIQVLLKCMNESKDSGFSKAIEFLRGYPSAPGFDWKKIPNDMEAIKKSLHEYLKDKDDQDVVDVYKAIKNFEPDK